MDTVSECADVVELVAPVHTCTGEPFMYGERTIDCGFDWSTDPNLVRTLDPHYIGPLDEFCPNECNETRSTGQYACSGGCEVEPARTTCTGAPFECRPPFNTPGDFNYTRCSDAVDAASCTAMQNDDFSVDELLGCVAVSTVRISVHRCPPAVPPAVLHSHGARCTLIIVTV